MQNDKQQFFFIVIAITVTLVLLVLAIMYQMLQGRNRKLRFSNDLLEKETQFQNEIMKTQVEVTDSTLNDVASELHDNIGQMLTLTLMQMNSLTIEGNEAKIQSIRETLQQTIQELRAISKDLSSDFIGSMNLNESIQRIFDRVSRSGIIHTYLEWPSYSIYYSKDLELILFRMIQELINNSLKHAQATEIKLIGKVAETDFELTYTDNGKGFMYIPDAHKSGMGLASLNKRASLLKAKIEIETAPDKGFKLSLKGKC